MRFHNSLYASVSLVLMASIIPTPSFAQEETAQVFSQDNAQGVATIIVTSQKREQNVQDVPLAITAFGEQQLEAVGANNIERLDAVTPGLEWGQFGLGARISVRGQGVANFEANTDGPVGLFVDGIYLGRGQQIWSSLTDIERVEVTRGPQGTLFGRNTTGGSINIVPNKPDPGGIEAGANIEIFQYDGRSADGFLNLPLGEHAAVRFSAYYEKHDGFIENQFPDGDDYLDEDMVYFRGSVRFEPSDRLTIDLAADYWDQGGNGAAFSGIRFFDQGTPQFNTWAASLAGLPPTALPANGGEDRDWRINLDGDSTRDVQSLSVVGTVQYETDDFIIKSVSGYSDYEQFAGGDSDFSTLALADLSLDTQAELFSTELQIQSATSNPLSWIVGLYYLDETIDELFRFNFIPSGFDFSTRDGTSTTQSYAAYADATYYLSDQFAVLGGLRYTIDDRGYESFDFARTDDRGTVDASETFRQLTWRAGVQFFPNNETQLYALVSTGYKAGGFNRYQPPAGGVLNYNLVFQPETILNYEAGLKADFLDNRLRTNLAVFYNELDDFQAYAFDNSLPSSITTNAATASTFGVELEATAVPVSGLNLQAIVAYLDAKYDSYEEFSNGSINIDASGNKRELAPEWKITLVGSYDIDLGSAGTLTPYAQTTYKSSYFVTAANEPIFGLDRQGSYWQSDVRLRYTTETENLYAEAYVTNIGDNFVKTGGFLATNGYWLTYGPEPRIFGLRAGFKYR